MNAAYNERNDKTVKEIIINTRDKGQRIDKYLSKYFSDLPTSFLYKMFRKKNIKLNSKKIEGNEILQEKDLIEVFFKDETFYKFKNGEGAPEYNTTRDIQLNVVYEDKNMMVVSKEDNLSVHSNDDEEENTLIDIVTKYLHDRNDEEYLRSKDTGFMPALCNRLDRNTRGLVLIGKNYITTKTINEMIKNREVEKYYIAVVSGKMPEYEEKTLRGFIIKNSKSNTSTIIDKEIEGSKYAETRYRVLRSQDDYSILEINLITGRGHQIRAHMKSIGHPIIGDSKYGENTVNRLFKRNYDVKTQLLFAYKIILPKGLCEKQEIKISFDDIFPGKLKELLD